MSLTTSAVRRAGLVTVGLVLLVACSGDGDAVLDLGGPSTTAATVAPDGQSTTSSPSPSTAAPPTTLAPFPTSSTVDPRATGSPLTTRSRFHVRGVGPVHAGMTIREAEQAAGVRLRVLNFDAFDGLCYYAEADGFDGLSFMVGSRGPDPPSDPRDGVILRAQATGAPWETLPGIRVGSTEAAVTAAYGSRIEREPHVYQPGGNYLTLTGTGADARFGIRFETTPENVVDDFFSGDSDAITAIEGCA